MIPSFSSLSGKTSNSVPPSEWLGTVFASAVTFLLCLLITYVAIGFFLDALEPPAAAPHHTLSTNAASMKRPVLPKNVHRSVEDLSRCFDCHEWGVKPDDEDPSEKSLALIRKTPADSCSICHGVKDIETVHLHSWEPIQDCDKCHLLHGTAVSPKGLLRASPQILCVQCHERRVP